MDRFVAETPLKSISLAINWMDRPATKLNRTGATCARTPRAKQFSYSISPCLTQLLAFRERCTFLFSSGSKLPRGTGLSSRSGKRQVVVLVLVLAFTLSSRYISPFYILPRSRIKCNYDFPHLILIIRLILKNSKKNLKNISHE